MVVPVFKIKVLAGLLKIDMGQVVCPASKTFELQSLDTFIRARRTELGLSPAEFADKAGFYPVFCDVVESHATRTGSLSCSGGRVCCGCPSNIFGGVRRVDSEALTGGRGCVRRQRKRSLASGTIVT